MKTISLLKEKIICKMCDNEQNRLKYVTEYDTETGEFIVIGFCSEACRDDYNLLKKIDKLVV